MDLVTGSRQNDNRLQTEAHDRERAKTFPLEDQSSERGTNTEWPLKPQTCDVATQTDPVTFTSNVSTRDTVGRTLPSQRSVCRIRHHDIIRTLETFGGI